MGLRLNLLRVGETGPAPGPAWLRHATGQIVAKAHAMGGRVAACAKQSTRAVAWRGVGLRMLRMGVHRIQSMVMLLQAEGGRAKALVVDAQTLHMAPAILSLGKVGRSWRGGGGIGKGPVRELKGGRER